MQVRRDCFDLSSLVQAPSVDNLQNTAGDIALSFNDAETHAAIRDAGIRSELLLSLLSSREISENPSTLILKGEDSTAAGSTDAFLSSKLRFTKDEHDQDICMVQVGDEEIGVMMGWERDIMKNTVQKLCQNHDNTQGLKVLNVGFGLGIIPSSNLSLLVLHIMSSLSLIPMFYNTWKTMDGIQNRELRSWKENGKT